MSTDLTDAREDRPDRPGVAGSTPLTPSLGVQPHYTRPLPHRVIAPRPPMVGVNVPRSNVGVLVGVLSPTPKL